MNLLTNGIKYNKDGGRLIVNAINNGQRIIITVQDTGMGIAPDDQRRMFTEFYRSEEAMTVDPGGVGLGLYVTRQFIRLHGGEIGLSSVVGQGTIFTISLPLPPANPPESGKVL